MKSNHMTQSGLVVEGALANGSVIIFEGYVPT